MFPLHSRSSLSDAGLSKNQVNAIEGAVCEALIEIIREFQAEFRRWHAFFVLYMLAQIGIVLLTVLLVKATH